MYPVKSGIISKEDGGVVSRIYCLHLMVSYFFSFNPYQWNWLKLTRTLAAIMFSSIESRHPWQTSRVRVIGSNRRPFILILDWMLVNATFIIWMNLSPYWNFCKAEKTIKSTTGYYSAILSRIVERVCQIVLLFDSSWLVFSFYCI